MNFKNLNFLISLLLLNFSLVDAQPLDAGDVAALTDFYNSLTSIGTLPPWNLNPTLLCSQEGIECSEDNPKRVTSITLTDYGLEGPISAQLGALTELQILFLNTNSFTGPIPTDLGNLTQIFFLALSENQLTGEIPEELGKLTQAMYIDLGWNKLTGNIPSQLAGISFLETLYLSHNNLTGPIPTEFGQSSLMEIDIISNQLSGEIPKELGQASSLKYLYASNNQFIGEIPKELGNIQLTTLALAYNQLTGTIPSELNLSNYATLRLNHNKLSGPVPVELGNLPIIYIDLSNNELNGTFPTALPSNLEALHLNNNRFTGTIPTEYDDLSLLIELNLASNYFPCPVINYGEYADLSDYNVAVQQCSTSCPNGQCLSGGECWIQGDEYDLFKCICPPEASGTQCEISSCSSFICENGGTCTLEFGVPKCICELGYSGTNCELSACDSFTCDNGGVCGFDDSGNPECSCADGYGGVNCEIDYCSINSCQNGGICNPLPDGSSCSCSIYYRGPLCQYQNPLISPVPMAYYSFKSASKLLDETGNGHDLSPFLTDSKNYALNYDPSNDALGLIGTDLITTASTISLGNVFTISAVFSISKLQFTTSLVLLTNDLSLPTSFNVMVYQSGSIEVSINGAVVLRSNNFVIEEKIPYLVTVVKNNNIIRIYKNGVPVATSTTAPLVNLSNKKMYIGYNFVGVLDEVAIYSTNIPQSQVSSHASLLNLPTTKCTGCHNYGTCASLNSGSTCFCRDCFYGPGCQSKIYGCVNPCVYGKYISNTCQCTAGYTGSNCFSTKTCDPIIGDPTGIFGEGTAYQATTGTCPPGKTGTPRRQCLHDGSWRSVVNPCA